MAVTTSIPDPVWSARTTHYLTKYSAFIGQTNRQWEGDAEYGNKVRIITIDRSTVIFDYSRTADLTAPEDIDTTTTDLAIDQEKAFNFMMEDLDARQSRISGAQLVDVKAEGAGIEMSQVVDAHVVKQLNDATGSTLAANVAAADFNLKFVAAVKKTAALLNLPVGQVVCVLTPELIQKIEEGIIDKTYGDIMTAANFGPGYGQDPNSEGGESSGFWGMLNGIRIFVSNRPELKLTSSNGAVSGGNRGARSIVYIYDPRDLGLVVQVNKTEVYRLEKRFATGVKGLVNYGSKLINPARVQKLIFND